MRAHSKQISWDLVSLFLLPVDLARLRWQVPSGLQSFWYISCIALCGWVTSCCLCSPTGRDSGVIFCPFASRWLAVSAPHGASLAAVLWGRPRVPRLHCCGQADVTLLLHSFPLPLLPCSKNFIDSWTVLLREHVGTSCTSTCAGSTGGSVTAASLTVPFSLPLCLWFRLSCSWSERFLPWCCAFSPEALICQTQWASESGWQVRLQLAAVQGQMGL